MIDREELAARIFTALHSVERRSGAYASPIVSDLVAESFAVAQTFASHACRQFGHVYGGEGHMHEHECARCGGDIATLVNADRAAWKDTQGQRSAAASYFQPKKNLHWGLRLIEPRCHCDDGAIHHGPIPARLAAFVADLVFHGATVREVDPLEARRTLASTADDGAGPFSKRKR